MSKEYLEILIEVGLKFPLDFDGWKCEGATTNCDDSIVLHYIKWDDAFGNRYDIELTLREEEPLKIESKFVISLGGIQISMMSHRRYTDPFWEDFDTALSATISRLNAALEDAKAIEKSAENSFWEVR